MRIDTNLPGAVIAKLRRQFRINYFLETGTGGGDATELAAIMFDRVFSCDIDSTLIARANERLKDYSNVLLACEPSVEFLLRVKPQLNQPIIYWLDAHWSGGRLKPERECPLLDELAAIGSLHGHSVLLVDDVNYMLKTPPPPHDPTHWPELKEVYAVLDSWGEDLTKYLVKTSNSEVLVCHPKLETRK